MEDNFSYLKKEPNQEDLWREFKKTFEQGVHFSNERNRLPGVVGAFDQVNPDWVRKHEEKFLREAELNY